MLNLNYISITPLVASFLITLFLLPFWIRKAKQLGLEWIDMNKFKKEKIAGSGGIVVLLSFLIGVFLYVAYRVFILKSMGFLIEILALLIVILISSGIGFMDDLFGWRKGGLSRRSRIILLAFTAIPLMAINAGKAQIGLPFIGIADIGIIYPLIFIPVGIVGATTTYNFLAGFNGLEAGQGVIILSALSIVAYLTGNSWLAVVALCMVAALFAFLFSNIHPAKVFPGDSLTYAVGSLIAIIAILGNIEKIAVFFFIPYILETLLKLRGNLRKHSFGKPNKDNTLNLHYDKIYGLEHLAIWLLNKTGIKATEKKVVYSIWIFQFIIIILGFIIFRSGIFM